jgi:hypothetical protein
MIKSLRPQQIWISGTEQSRRSTPNQKQGVKSQSVGSEDENKFQIQLSSIPKAEEPFSDLTLNVNPSKDTSERDSYVIDVIQSYKLPEGDPSARHQNVKDFFFVKKIV